MKRIFLILFFIFCPPAFSNEVLAPALQFSLDEYKEYFKSPNDFKLNLKTLTDYKISCEDEISGVEWGDTENIKMSEIRNEYTNELDMNNLVIKLKYQTYSYIRLYMSTWEVINIILTINPVFEPKLETIGTCTIAPYRG